MTLILSNEDVERVLTMQDSLKAMEITFTDYAAAKAVNRPRSHTYTPLDEDGKFYCFKSMDGVPGSSRLDQWPALPASESSSDQARAG